MVVQVIATYNDGSNKSSQSDIIIISMIKIVILKMVMVMIKRVIDIIWMESPFIISVIEVVIIQL